MKFAGITVIILFLIYFFMSINLDRYRNELRKKYNARTWHYGYFADLKLYKLLNNDDKAIIDEKSKKLNRFLLFIILYTIFIFSLSGIILKAKL
jgi:Ni,Fe-hydrogenase I cytochrome b subunit